ncbi:hypothetical protein [Streptomyces sp. NPDC006971]|uniref:hypothetical protein n=1 Tax=Streptomyces sp. NPDC006971 TaxID=3154784 RepID=UPI0033C9731F
MELLPCVVARRGDTGTARTALSRAENRIDTQIGTLVDTQERLDTVIAAATTTFWTGRPCP